PRSVLIFAAGFGTRMGALTAERPKPLLPVAGRPLIDRALALARDAGTGRIVVNLHYKAEMLRQHLAGSGAILSEEMPEILETGGGLRAALPLLGPGPVFTLNSDAVWSGPNPLRLLAEAWEPGRMDALLLCVEKERARGHRGAGDFTIGKGGCATRGPGAVFSGAQIVRTDALDDIPQTAFSLNLLWDRMLADGRLFALTYPGRWCDVGRPEGIALAETMLEEPDV
ncbi:MAG: nucleotidyltransferase family protein, partial [Roseovarius sp.]|nr:nucleotidyltransferase family protein [Roseovarius sp.]